MKKMLALLLSAAMLVGLLASCGTYTADPAADNSEDTAAAETADAAADTADAAADTADASAEAQTLTFVSTEPNTMNLIQSQSNLDSDVFYLVSAMLYRNYCGEDYPELAEGYTVSDDGLTYTYTIKDAVYADGTPITAADFAYYMVQHLPYAEDYIFYVNGPEFVAGECEASDVGIYAADDHTLVVELNATFADFDPELEIYPLNQEFAEAQGENLGGTADNFLCSGPYVLTDWTVGSSMTFVKNDSYIDAENSFPIQNLKMISSTDSTGRYAIFSSGEADVLCSVSDELAAQIGEDLCTHLESIALQGLEINTTGMYYDGTTFAARDEEVTALLANENFRKALSYALDRETIVSVVNPSARAYNRFLMNGVEGSTEGSNFIDEYPLDLVPMSGDQELAKQYLAAALEELGYSDVSELPTVKYLTFDSDMYRLMAETLQSEWKTILGLTNIEIDIQPVSDAIMSMVFMDYDIYYASVSSELDTPCIDLGYWTTGGGLSDAMQSGAPFANIYANSDYDALVESATYDQDAATRCELLAEAEQMFLDANVFIPIQINDSDMASQSYVHDFYYHATEYGYQCNYTTIDAH